MELEFLGTGAGSPSKSRNVSAVALKLLDEIKKIGVMIMSEELNQDKYTIDLMKTLWENTFRGTIFDYKNQYIATVRIVFNIPLDRDLVPDNAPEVSPAIIVLVEDTIISPIDVVSFEQTITPILVKKLTSRYFQPDRVMFFYPSPAEGAETKER